MTWYYMDGKQEIGPVSKAELQSLIKAKRITGKTLVRSANSDQWRPLAEMVRPKSQGQTSSSAPASAASRAPEPERVSTDSPAAPSAVCSQCGRSFPKDQVVNFDDQVICAACKPMFVQRLKEGGPTTGVPRYGGFWIRFGAKMIDWLILGTVQYAIIIPMSMMFFPNLDSLPDDPEAILNSGIFILLGIQTLIGLAIPVVYNTYLVGRFSATVGKMACRLKVVTPDGDKVTYLRALGRHFAEIVTAFTFSIGYIIAGFDAQKRALHDHIASTRVVFK